MKKIESAYVSLAGGGMLVLCHLGFLWALRERGIKVAGAAGTSAGALAAGCSASDLEPGPELNELLLSFFPVDKNLMDVNLLGFPRTYGAMSLKRLEKELKKYLPNTFADCRHPVAVFTSNIDAQDLGEWSTRNTPDQDLTARVVDSCRIPGVFQARFLKGEAHTDGGLIYNYPIDYWMQKGFEDLPIIGVRFDGTVTGPLPPRKPWYRFFANGIRHFMGHASLVMDALSEEAVEDAPGAHHIVLGVPPSLRELGISGMSFDMTRAQAETLIEYARQQTHIQLDNIT